MDIQDLSFTFRAYIEEATRLRGSYADRMTILIGLETELIHDESLDELLQVLNTYRDSIEYVVGSLHHVNGIPIDFDEATFKKCLATFEDEQAYFQAYFDAQFELIQACHPEVIGHFDLCRLFLPEATFDESTMQKIKRNIDYMNSYGGLIEVNAAAFRKGWKTAYPAPDILQLLLARKGRLCLSDDSHGPHAVGLHYNDAYKYLRDQNVQTLYHLEHPQEGEKCTVGRKRTVIREIIEWRLQVNL